MIHFIYPVTERTRPWSRLNTLAVKLARKHYPEKKIIVWTNSSKDVPDIYAKDIIVRQMEMPIEHTYPQYVSDYFRLKLLYEHGGMYLDTDMLLLKQLPDDFFLSWETRDQRSICNAIIQAAAGNEFIKEWWDAMPKALESSTWAYGGVVLPAELSKKYKMTIYDHTFACPLDLSKPWLFDPELKARAREMVKNSYAIHCFETYWQPYFDAVDDNSFLAELYREFE